MIDVLYLAHQTVFGGLAAAGFGVLFNIRLKALPWCALAGGLALCVRTLAMGQGLSLEAGSFLAAVAVGLGVQLAHVRGRLARSALAAAGCIPMIPGSIAAKAILGLFALTDHQTDAEAMAQTMQYVLRVIFTFAAIGVGVAFPMQIFRRRGLDV
ncbi:hypothetical protein CKO38_16720 [Rhodospirillum rubrum]|uniref:threonine/serine exporter family protein n=1 Tax=Rhodospirillum rubrum TaxID=1085 RepID=UPI001906AD3C|nr:threonine/serine exporter family protein [Rhodospirillum rubrum]MBK1666152.1 hypothetical protein [Rhodospirillum rubrum]MBK1678286.1 hypothetical protein [Rhodospirillum rubrum]